MTDAFEVTRPLWIAVAAASVPLLLIAISLGRRMRLRALERFVSAFQVERLVILESPVRFSLRCLLVAVGIALVTLALARPRWGTKVEVVSRKGVDVIVALDTSLSMLSEDVKPSRLALAKRMISDLVDRIGGNRIGIVAFAGDAYVACPLTLDHGAAKMFLDDVGPFSVSEAGTAVGTAIRHTIQAFGRKEQKYKVLVLMTDGEDHRTDPEGAAAEALEAGVVIHALGFGSGEGAPIPMKEGGAVDYKKDKGGEIVVSKLDEAMLASVAARTGGSYFRATPGEAELEKLLAAIEQMDKVELSQKLHSLKEERFQLPLVAGLLLLCLELVLRGARPRRRGAPGVAARAAPVALLAAAAIGVIAGGRDASAAPPLTGPAVEVEKGNALYEEGKLDAALAEYAAARAKVPDSPTITYDVGNVLFRQQKYEDAAREFQRAAEHAAPDGAAPDRLPPSALYNLGNTLVKQGKLEEALVHYERTLRAAPGDADAKWNYELVRMKLAEQQKQQQKKDQQKQDQQEQQKDQQQEKQESSPEEEKKEEEQKKEEEEKQKKKEQEKKDEEQKKQQQGEEEGKNEQKEEQKQDGGAGQEGELTPEQAEKVLDAFLQLEKQTKEEAERKKRKAIRASKPEDW